MKLQYTLPKHGKQAKSMSRKYTPEKVSEVAISITNKYGKLKV